MMIELFSQIYIDNHVKNILDDLYNYEKLEKLFYTNTNAFLDEYKKEIRLFEQNIRCVDYSQTVNNALIMLKFVEINVRLKLDHKLLTDSLVILADIIQMLETVYEAEMFENYLGTVIAYKISNKICDLLQRENSETKEFIVNAVSQIPVMNTTLVGWNYCVLRYYGVRVSRKVTSASKALHLYDLILGDGISEMLLTKSKEYVEKQMTIFNNVGLHFLSDKILEFYILKTGNEKKRFLSSIEETIDNVDIVGSINSYLLDD